MVCATDQKRYRLQPLPQTFAQPTPPMARMALGNGVVADIHTDQRMVGGTPSNRIMVGVKLPF